MPDAEGLRRLDDLPAKCLCGFEGNVKSVSAHKANDCPRRLVYCRLEGCGDVVRFPALTEHEELCPHQLATCTACGHKCTQRNMERHCKIECPAEQVRCPAKCGKDVRRDTQTTHVTQECEHTVMLCPVPGCKYIGRRHEMEKHNMDKLAAHLRLMTHHSNRVQLGVARGTLKQSDMLVVYGDTAAVVFTIPHLKDDLTTKTSFLSPCIDVFDARWQVSLERDDRSMRWHVYLCLVSSNFPLQLKVMFLLQSGERKDDHAAIIDGTIEVKENKKYGVPIQQEKLEEYSTNSVGNDGKLIIKVIMQKIATIVSTSH
ncbi:TRAF4 [Branchiostoma lanceolatum]|uniref:TRAF4 protein n=1 Tax=Branchiostoma lanceolatum TaxID=7740 RepID=A0A8S4MMZ0_BRALA|nr:TRAF4 [Branchiostoma lanceolatum]